MLINLEVWILVFEPGLILRYTIAEHQFTQF